MKTAAQWKADERARKRALGFVLCQYWVHPADRERVNKYHAALLKRRNTDRQLTT